MKMTFKEMQEHARKKDLLFGERYGSGLMKINDMIKSIEKEQPIDIKYTSIVEQIDVEEVDEC